MRLRSVLVRATTTAIVAAMGLGVIFAADRTFALLYGAGTPVLYYTDSAYGFAPRENQRLVRQHGARVTIDALGLRATRDWRTPADLRILFIGDSVTWGGTAVDDGDTFAEQTCALLNRTGDRNTLCGNAGVNAYGTDNMRERLRFLPFDSQDVIVVTILTADTTRNLTRLGLTPYFAVPPAGTFPALTEVGVHLLYRFIERTRYHANQHRPDHDFTVATESIEALLMQLRAMQAKGKTVILVHALALIDVEAGGPQSWPAFTQHVDRLIEKSGFPIVRVVERLWEAGITPAYADGTHLSALGHRIYAEAIVEVLRHEIP